MSSRKRRTPAPADAPRSTGPTLAALIELGQSSADELQALHLEHPEAMAELVARLTDAGLARAPLGYLA